MGSEVEAGTSLNQWGGCDPNAKLWGGGGGGRVALKLQHVEPERYVHK